MNSILVEKPQMRDPLREVLKQAGIETRPTFYPIHTMPLYAIKYQKHPIAENLALRGINLPSYPALINEDVKYIVQVIKNFY